MLSSKAGIVGNTKHKPWWWWKAEGWSMKRIAANKIRKGSEAARGSTRHRTAWTLKPERGTAIMLVGAEKVLPLIAA